jgi:hypothetical protein
MKAVRTLVRYACLCAMLAALGAPMPAAASPLTPAISVDVGAVNVQIDNPRMVQGRTKFFALQVYPESRDNTPISRVEFQVSQQGRLRFSRTERQAPYCLFDNTGDKCNYQISGDRINNSYRLVVGTYVVKVLVYTSGAQPVWVGDVTLNLRAGDRTAYDLPYGTGSGNMEVVVTDPHWRPAGMRKVQIGLEVEKTQERKVRSVRFEIQRQDTQETVYVGYEQSEPYCIFGELDDRKTCRTVSVGDTWPASTLLANGSKKPDPDIPVMLITPDIYEISIRVDAERGGTWNTDAEFTLIN